MINNLPNPDYSNKNSDSINGIKIVYLSLNSNLLGPIPKIDPLLIGTLMASGCRIIKMPWGRHSEKETIFEKVFGRLGDIKNALLKLIRMRPDILYVATTLDEYGLGRDILLLFTALWSPARKVLIMHGGKSVFLSQPGHTLFKLLTRMLISLSDGILLLSNEEMQVWSTFTPSGKFFRVDNPFKSPNESNLIEIKVDPRKNESPILLFVGRLSKEKGIFDLIDAMPIILEQINCHLLIAGGGEEKAEIAKRINNADWGQAVSLLGYLDSDDLFDIYRSASVFILPTYREGFPTVIAEAMSFGLPIVTTCIGGTRDLLQEGVNALFVQPKDPESIANAVLTLLNNSGLCANMRTANLAKVQIFKPENVAPTYIKIFSELLKTN